MEKQNFLNLGKRLSASVVAAAIVFSTASVLPSFAAKESVESTQLHATGLIPDSQEVIEEHLASDKQIYNLDFIQADDPATEDALVGVCKAAKVAELPEKIELNHKYLPPVGDQGTLGSCVSWATVYYMKSYQEAEEHDWDLSDGNKKHIFSPSYNYSQLVDDDNDGTSYTDNMELIDNQGACPLYDMQYRSCKYKPNESQRDMASNYKGIQDTNVKWYTISGIDAIKTYLANGHPVVTSMIVNKKFDNIDGSNCVVDEFNSDSMSYKAWLNLSYDERKTHDYNRGGHGLCLVGYDENYNYNGKTVPVFKFVNSWGKYWGDNGYAYVTEETLASYYGNANGYIIDDKAHDDTNEFFTSAPKTVVAQKDVRAYNSADYFNASDDNDNYAKTYSKGSIIGIKKFVSCKENNQQPYFVTEDNYYINAQKDALVECDYEENIIYGDKNNSVYNYNNSESSKIKITPNSNIQYNNHNTLKIEYTINQNDSYNGYAGAKINTDKSIPVNGSKSISFIYMTPLGQNGTVALCLQGSVEKKIVELPTTNGQWKTFQSDYEFTGSTISDIEIYINGSENGCKTTLSNGVISLAEMKITNSDGPSYYFSVNGDKGANIEGIQTGKYKSGTEITVTAKVDKFYKFLGWSTTKGGEIISTDPTYSLTLNENTTLYANVYKYTTYSCKLVNCNSEYGMILDLSDNEFIEGTIIKAYAYPKLCYKFVGWSETENGPIVSSEQYYDYKLTKDTTLYAHFEKADTNSVEVISDSGCSSVYVTMDLGSSRPYTTSITKMDIPTGYKIELFASLNTGYKVVGWYDNAACTGTPLCTASSYKGIIVDKDMKIYLKTAKKEHEDYSFNIYHNPYMGSISGTVGTGQGMGNFGGTCESGTEVTVTAKPLDGYRFTGWHKDSYTGELLSSNNSYTFNVNSNTTIYASFEKIPEYNFTVTFRTAEGMVDHTIGSMYSQGTISGTCLEGTDVTVTAKPHDDYVFVGWCDGSYDGPVLSTSSTYTFTVNGETNIYAKFEKKAPEYIYRVHFRTAEGMVDYLQGSMHIQGTISGSCIAGTNITVTAKPRDNYQFVGWCDGSYDGTVLSTSTTYTFTVNKETDIYAKFVEKTVADDSNILVKGISNSISDWTNANSGSYLNITSGSSDYLFNGAKTLKLDYNINTNDQYGGYAGRTISLESTYKNDNSKGYNGIGFWYMTPADFNGQIALCLQSQSAGLDDLVQLPSTNGEWKYYFYQTDKTNLSDLTLYINGSKNGYTTTASNGIAKGTLYMANIEVNKK